MIAPARAQRAERQRGNPDMTKSPKGTGWGVTFAHAFCAKFKCHEQEFERLLFRRSLNWHAKPVAFLMRPRWRRAFFKEDFDVIHEVGRTRSYELFIAELNYFYGRNQRDTNWVRSIFGLRVSAKKLLALQRRLFAAET